MDYQEKRGSSEGRRQWSGHECSATEYGREKVGQKSGKRR